MRTAHRHFTRSLKPMGSARLAPIAELCGRVLDRIRIQRHTHVCGTWLLADDEGLVYTLGETSSACGVIVARHPDILVGLYCAGRFSAWPEHAQLVDDLTQHFADLGFALNPPPEGTPR